MKSECACVRESFLGLQNSKAEELGNTIFSGFKKVATNEFDRFLKNSTVSIKERETVDLNIKMA